MSIESASIIRNIHLDHSNINYTFEKQILNIFKCYLLKTKLFMFHIGIGYQIIIKLHVYLEVRGKPQNKLSNYTIYLTVQGSSKKLNIASKH
jgi:hypothetical protein